jgi:hypothetical protein
VRASGPARHFRVFLPADCLEARVRCGGEQHPALLALLDRIGDAVAKLGRNPPPFKECQSGGKFTSWDKLNDQSALIAGPI